METLCVCEILVEEPSLEVLTGLLALHVAFGWEEESLPTGQTRVKVHCEDASFIQNLADVVHTTLPDAQVHVDNVSVPDWIEAWKQFFTPVCCGRRFIVLPPWLCENTELEGRHPIIIEPKSAFGTGHHPTTALCLTVISDLLDKGRIVPRMRFLDLGTGSGVLGIGCCRAGLQGIGADIDQLAVANTQENITINAVNNFCVMHGGVDCVKGQVFDLVVANILAQPLRDMAPALTACVKKGGCLVLSGILGIQADAVEDAYRAQGMPAARRVIDGEWAALVWE